MTLAILKNSQDDTELKISSVPYVIGRSRTADLIIAHVTVSRNHCEIIKEDNLWKINDYSSSGTYVNDVLVGKEKFACLNNGDTIRFGPVESNLWWSFYESGVESNDSIQTNQSQEKNEKIQELTKELEEVQKALSNLEEKTTVLEQTKVVKERNLLENLADVMESELQCTICSELFVTAVTLGCTHTFCLFCINQWKKKQKTCPICRKKITRETRSLVVDNYIDKMVGNLSVELKERRETIIKERSESEPCKKKSRYKR